MRFELYGIIILNTARVFQHMVVNVRLAFLMQMTDDNRAIYVHERMHGRLCMSFFFAIAITIGEILESFVFFIATSKMEIIMRRKYEMNDLY